MIHILDHRFIHTYKKKSKMIRADWPTPKIKKPEVTRNSEKITKGKIYKAFPISEKITKVIKSPIMVTPSMDNVSKKYTFEGFTKKVIEDTIAFNTDPYVTQSNEYMQKFLSERGLSLNSIVSISCTEHGDPNIVNRYVNIELTDIYNECHSVLYDKMTDKIIHKYNPSDEIF